MLLLWLLSTFRKAFGNVDYHILVEKLYSVGIRGLAKNWFRSKINNRKQYVMLNGVMLNASFQLVYHKDLFWDHFFSWSISMTWVY